MLKKYFSFEGRINRFKFFFIYLLVSIPVYFFNKIVDLSGFSLIFIIAPIFQIPCAVLLICITVQRLHDIDRPGFHYWFLFIPFYNLYLILLLLFKKGTDGLNEYGEGPLTLRQHISG